MTILSPTVSATFGNLRYDSHVVSLQADLGMLPAVNMVTCGLPASTPVEASVGDHAVVSLDGGDGAATLITGTVGAISRRVDGTAVTTVDSGAALARLRPSATFEAQGVTEIARALAGDALATVGRLDTSIRLAAYAAHQGMSAAEHVAALGELGGLLAFVNDAGELEMIRRPLGLPDSALLFGREFTTYEVDELTGPLGSPVPIGHGPAGFAPSPDGLIPTTEPLSGGAPDPGPDAVWNPAPVLRTPEAVTVAATEASASQAAETTRLRATGWLLPVLRPGQLVEVQDLRDGLPVGPWLLTSVTHRLDPTGGGRTRIEAVVGGSALGSLLDAALGALGSLL